MTRSTVFRRRPRKDSADEVVPEDVTFDGLHWLTAGLFLAAGTEAGVGERRGDVRPAEQAVRWGPLIAAPLAGAAHAARALYPCRATATAAQVMNGLAVAVGSAGLAASLYALIREGTPGGRSFDRHSRWSERLPSLAPLTFAIAGLVGAVLDREERIDAYRHGELNERIRRLERRASIVERLFPRRKPKLDRIVVHV